MANNVSTKEKFMTTALREEWLSKAMGLIIEQVFVPHELRMPPILKISCGICSGKAIGQCHKPDAADDGAVHIFITPEHGSEEVMDILGTIVHELCHANCYAEGHLEAKHGHPFSSIIRDVGLEGKPKHATAHPDTELWATLQGIASTLGEYPHKPLRKQPKATRRSEVLTWVSPTDDKYTVKCKYSLTVEKGVPRDFNSQPMVAKDPDKLAELENLMIEAAEELEAAE